VLSAARRQFPFAGILRVFRRDRQVHSDLRLLTGGLHGGGAEKLAEDEGGGERPKHSLDRVIDQPMLADIFVEQMHCLSPQAAQKWIAGRGDFRLDRTFRF